MSDAPTGPIPVVRAQARRRRRVAALLVVVAIVVLVGAVAVAVRAVVGLGTAGDTAVALPPPLLPGAPTVTVPPPAPAATVAGVGYDVSYPQCRSSLPADAAFGIVGVNGGAPLLSNTCFATQVAWARSTGAYAVYINTAYIGRGDPVAYGRRLAEDAIARERNAGVSGIGVWWLDVEVTNTWRGTTQENATVLAAAAARLQEAGVRVGIYSTPAQWSLIAGSWAPGLPVWNASGATRESGAVLACEESFAGSTSAMVQWVQKVGTRSYDHNVICPAWSDRAGDLLDVGRA